MKERKEGQKKGMSARWREERKYMGRHGDEMEPQLAEIREMRLCFQKLIRDLDFIS